MDELNVPIFRKAYDLYKAFHMHRNAVPKQDRYVLWHRIEASCLLLIELLFLAGQRRGDEKRQPLEQASVTLNMLRVLVRLAKDTKTIDPKTYAAFQVTIDDIGRMLGGWIKSVSTVGKPL